MKKMILTLIYLMSLNQGLAGNDSVERMAAESIRQAQDSEQDVIRYLEKGESSSPQEPSQPFLWQSEDKGDEAIQEESVKDYQNNNKQRPASSENVQSPNQNTSTLVKRKSCTNLTCKGEEVAASNLNNDNHQIDIIVFVSFSIPDESLKAYARDLEKVGGRIVIRGLINDSFKETQKKLMELGISIEIDPILFEQYKVSQVPTILCLKHSNDYDLLVGHIPLGAALEEFSDNGNEGAQKSLKKLKEARI